MDNQFLQSAALLAGLLTALVVPVLRWCWSLQSDVNKAGWERTELNRRVDLIQMSVSSHQEVLTPLHTRISLLEKAIERQGEILGRLHDLSEKLNELQSSIASLQHHEQNHTTHRT